MKHGFEIVFVNGHRTINKFDNKKERDEVFGELWNILNYSRKTMIRLENVIFNKNHIINIFKFPEAE